MVLPIVLLAVSLILTFGGTLMRLFDRLGIGFKVALFLQFLLIVIVVFPHVTAPKAQSSLAITSYLLLLSVGLIYWAHIRRLRFFAAACCAFAVLLLSLIGLSVLFAGIELPEYAVQLLLGAIAAGILFTVCRDHSGAFLCCILAGCANCAVIFFTPLFFTVGLSAAALCARTINVTVYGLFGGLLLMNLFKRLRGNYAQNKESSARYGR